MYPVVNVLQFWSIMVRCVVLTSCRWCPWAFLVSSTPIVVVWSSKYASCISVARCQRPSLAPALTHLEIVDLEGRVESSFSHFRLKYLEALSLDYKTLSSLSRFTSACSIFSTSSEGRIRCCSQSLFRTN